MDRRWFAHSLPDQPESAWEPLARHLERVEREAALRAEKFGAGSLGAVAGRLHDLGKYNPAFLGYIRDRGNGKRIDHASAGANYARQRFGFAGCLLAHAIAAHHAGLSDRLFDEDGRLERTFHELDRIAEAAEADGLELPKTVVVPNLRPMEGERGFQLSLLVRMLLSCLVDADRQETRAFYAASAGESVTHEPATSLAVLAETLAAWMRAQVAAREKAGTSRSPVNRFRAEVLEHVLASASNKPGVFTLTVPTGGGKTLTSLAFALEHGRRHGMERVIVVIPFTSVIEQTAEVYRAALAPYGDAILEHHSAFDETRLSCREGQEMLRLAMESWDRPIIVTTAVQFFESLFSNRPSRCRKLHNLARSVIVLDEAQTIPLPVLRPCVAALRELTRNYGSSVVLCSATQPALEERADDPEHSFSGGFRAPVELAPEPPRLFAALRRVAVRAIGELDDQALAARLGAAEQTLCIVNSRAHARELFRLIQDLPGAVHLSTCMHAAHRSRVLAQVRADLKARRPCRLVATSLVEAGVDLDFPLVLRAEAGLDSIAQAAGRCNREGERPASESEVIVFRAPGHLPPRELRVNVETGAEILRLHQAEPLAPEAIEAYFRALYWRKGSANLDRYGILELCEEQKGTLRFPFKKIGEVRLIEDAMAPVIVPKEDAGKVEPLLRELRFAEHPGGIARNLQRFVVGVPRKVRGLLIAQGLAQPIRPELFEDQFVVLANLDLYQPDVGLDWSDPVFANAEGLIV